MFLCEMPQQFLVRVESRCAEFRVADPSNKPRLELQPRIGPPWSGQAKSGLHASSEPVRQKFSKKLKGELISMSGPCRVVHCFAWLRLRCKNQSFGTFTASQTSCNQFIVACTTIHHLGGLIGRYSKKQNVTSKFSIQQWVAMTKTISTCVPSRDEL